MKLTKIRIENFKSIDNLEFEVKKFQNSYTSMFVGINEVGKSNILLAMSFLDTPKTPFNFFELNNQNNEKNEYIDLYYELEFKNKKTYLELLQKRIVESDKFLKNLQVQKVIKNVFLKKGENLFQEQYELELNEFKVQDYFYSTLTTGEYKIKPASELKEDEKDANQQLDEEKLNEIILELLAETIQSYETQVSFWKPEKEYLITEPINLNLFKENSTINKPLKNIFALSKYKTDAAIKTKIEEIVGNINLRRGLQTKLSKNATNYFGNVWKHKIEIDIEISETLMCNVNIKDKGKQNEEKFSNMNSRSEGFKQFMSLILSLSIQNYSLNMKNRLILIDEPENHLHPSGIKDIKRELLKIGEENYIFLATHSCFMIDNKTPQRNFIITKDDKKNTSYNQIDEESEVFDDEVLRDAFGINVYKDFLSPNKILVEGLSDKKLLEKTILKLDIPQTILITNGHGENIISVASKFNYEDIDPIVILDDDNTGRKNKELIKKIGGHFSDSNVLTLSEIENKIITKGTIEDLLDKSYVEAKFKEVYDSTFENKLRTFLLNPKQPFIEQIKIHLHKNEKGCDQEKFMTELKIKIAQDFNPTITTLDTKFPLLKSLVEKIVQKLLESQT